MLSVSNVSKMYAGRTLFSGVGFHLQRGEKIGLIGPNGAGKSTLFSLLMGVETPDSGEITTERSVQVGFLPQESAPVEDVSGVGLWPVGEDAERRLGDAGASGAIAGAATGSAAAG